MSKSSGYVGPGYRGRGEVPSDGVIRTSPPTIQSELWVVGQIKGKQSAGVWEFQGIFDSEAKAEAACRNPRYFMLPAMLNEEIPDETVMPTDARYPAYEQLPEDEKYAAWQEIFGDEHQSNKPTTY